MKCSAIMRLFELGELGRDGRIAIDTIRWRLTTSVRWRQRNEPKSVLHFQSFFFCLLNLLYFRFSRFRRRRRKSSSFLVAQARKTILDMRRFCWKNRPFDEKRATKKTSTVSNKEAPIILKVKTTHSFKTNDHFRTRRPCFSCKATKQEKTGHKDKFILLISTRLLPRLYYYMRNFCTLIGLEQWYFSLIWNT